MPKFHRIVCGLSFRSAAFERGERGGASFGAGAGVNFSLAGGAKGASSRRTAKVKLVLPFSHSRHGVALQPAHC